MNEIKTRVRIALLMISAKTGVTLSECAEVILEENERMIKRDLKKYEEFILENPDWEYEKAELELVAQAKMI
jgi:hypothetical protein